MALVLGQNVCCFAQDSDFADFDRSRIFMSIRGFTTMGIAGLVASLGAVGMPQVASAASGDLVLVGHGWGHGRGMGQYGAFGYAVDHGWSSDRILSHYYGGTRPGQIGNPFITVRLRSLERPGNPLRSTGSWITSSQSFTVGGLLVAGGSAARIIRSGGRWHLFTTFHGCAAGNGYGPFTLTAATVATKTNPGDDTSRMLRVCASGRSYRGTISAVPHGTSVLLVNRLPMNSYLRGVVPRESPASWGDAGGGRGMAALRAQAVAARSYAQAENRNPPYAKTCDTTSCQMYGGAADHGTPIEDPRSDRSVATTTGQVRRDAANKVVRTEFSASTGGWTVPGGLWPAVRDEGDSRSPFHTWTTTLSGAALARMYGVGAFRQLLVTAQNGLGVEGGRAQRVRIVGSTGSRTVSGTQFSSDWNLSSDWFFPVDQPRQQVTWLRYVRVAGLRQIYRQFSLASRGWTDHAPISPRDWIARGSPAVRTVPAGSLK
jgi:SpoIID/LytB domain protein